MGPAWSKINGLLVLIASLALSSDPLSPTMGRPMCLLHELRRGAARLLHRRHYICSRVGGDHWGWLSMMEVVGASTVVGR